MPNESEITSVDDVSKYDEEYTVSNCKEFTQGKIAMMNKVIVYARHVKYTNSETEKEEEKDLLYFYIDINGNVKPTRLNKFTKDAFALQYKSNDPKKWLGKTVQCVHSTIGKNTFLVWKPSELK